MWFCICFQYWYYSRQIFVFSTLSTLLLYVLPKCPSNNLITRNLISHQSLKLQITPLQLSFILKLHFLFLSFFITSLKMQWYLFLFINVFFHKRWFLRCWTFRFYPWIFFNFNSQFILVLIVLPWIALHWGWIKIILYLCWNYILINFFYFY